MKIISNKFENNQKIPSKYSCDGESVNPPLGFSDIPENSKSLVLIVDDPDAPMGTFDHWVVYNIDPKIKQVEENCVPSASLQGLNSARNTGWISPCPPSGMHRYIFNLYALDGLLNFEQIPTKQEVEKAMQSHILARSELIGLYSRNKSH